ncbi:non-ribosomal peptide synthetase [Actinocrispum wychmicini]|uniref:Amino acid adenylation domain-containing protein/thioester reductase-like protein n=1 Tax=Actinocrispum wychmicini TaxID=1213861 RepID=A0A4R2JLC6_9PSEU|nr:amino acid adenylation domain-containing protein [Actinocrispum wychmicini]TCO60863.1 amino acid adenylation domain-containing protein/thioester reductase-like protein [Actinocrispum wychmicini]
MSTPSVSAGDPDDTPYVPVSELIARQALATPDRPAITCHHNTLTYRKLDELAGGLAGKLAAAGVRRGDLVPVLMVNSLELPVACLALMKLGAAFVPLDPLWPVQRVLAALDVLTCPIVLHGPTAPPDGHHGRPFEVDVRRIPLARRPPLAMGPDEPAYGIFTSGTTGTPKCAVNTHGGLANRFRFMTRYFRATGDEVVLQNSKHTFDSSLWQLLWPLTGGGHVILPAHREFLDLHRTVDLIAEHRVTASDFVSSIFNALVTLVQGEPELLPRLSSLRWLIVGSEPVNLRAVRTLTTLLPDLKVTNGYGPTETAIGMAFHPMSDADGDLVPLGRPIDNCHAAIVDDDLRPVPIGDLGEIMIGGACVGAGYVHAAGATARAFVPNPLRPEIPGDRVYLTGDLGRMDAHGRLFYGGRKDFQVKIGGMRIELDEIKAVAESCPGVRQAEVLVADEDGEKSLALFVACGIQPTEDKLRAHLSRSLPRTSMPARYFFLVSIPVNDNAKADRDELAVLLDKRLALDADRLRDDESATDLDARVLQSMRSALRRPDLSATDHFMDAGGDSLKALTVVNTIRAEFGVQEVCAQDLFDHPTAERLALVVRTYQADDTIVRSEEDLMTADARSEPDMPITTATREPPRTVLLTGATGFVGARIAYDILAGTDLRLVCLARAGDDDRATRRVVDVLAGRGWWDPAFADRLTGFAADLALPRLALADPVWDRLAEDCDLIMHSAALVNFLYDYRAHRRANVLGTTEVLRLAMSGRPAPLHYVSTLAALQSATDRATPLAEDVDVVTVDAPPGGYNRSKWVIERRLALARQRGALVTVLRLGEVMPADNGIPNTSALSHLLLTAFHRMGVVPDVDIWSDYTPVDYAARRLVAAALDPTTWGATLNIRHSDRVDFTRLLPGLTTVSCTDFLAALADTQDREPGLLAAFLPKPGELTETELRAVFSEVLTDNVTRYDGTQAEAAQRGWELGHESLDPSITAYRRYLAGRTVLA